MIAKLKINSSYSVYTKLRFINGDKVKVTGILNYDELENLPFSITNLAINEKVVDTTNNAETDTYLKKQQYYLCKYINNEEKVLILWDDVIDSNKTTRLNVDYNYNLKLSVTHEFEGSIDDVINDIQTLLFDKYKTQLESSFINTSVNSYENPFDSDNTEDTINYYREVLGEAMAVVQKIASLKQIETAIDMFVKGEFNNKMKSLIDQFGILKEGVDAISSIIL